MSMPKTNFNDEELKQYILRHFKVENGVITRDDRKNSNGSLDRDGYLILKIKGKQFKAHRIVWLLTYGEYPNGEIDHINRIRTDNRVENLRIATRLEQVWNTSKKTNANTKVVGVHIDTTEGLKKRFATSFRGKTYRFLTLDEAVQKRKELLEDLVI